MEKDTETLNWAVPYRVFEQRNPEFKLEYWERCRAFYKGGPTLLENKDVMNRVFPKHAAESLQVYEKRQAMAHYTNYAGEIVNHMTALLACNPLSVTSDSADPFYQEFNANVSPEGREERSLSDLTQAMMQTAMQTRHAWALIELPRDKKDEYSNLAEQEKYGARRAWAVEIMPECVIDWECDESGGLEWALVKYTSKKRESLLGSRSITTEKYVYYDSQMWVEWIVQWEKQPPKPDEIFSPSDAGVHTFGKPPLVMLCLPEGLWVMGKLESLCREHLNKSNALSWAEYKALLPVLYEFLDPGVYPQLAGPGGEDDRAVNQKRGVSYVQERQAAPGAGDRAEWIAPPDAPFGHALASCSALRDEMHRVVHEMALSADNAGKTLVRSGESKQQDAASLAVVLEALGELARRAGLEIIQMAESGRGDEPAEWKAHGMDDFDTVSSGDMLQEEAILDMSVQIPSPTFKKVRKTAIARKLLGDWASPDDIEQIEEEIETYYSLEGEQQSVSDGEAADEITRESARAQIKKAEQDKSAAEADDEGATFSYD